MVEACEAMEAMEESTPTLAVAAALEVAVKSAALVAAPVATPVATVATSRTGTESDPESFCVRSTLSECTLKLVT